MKKKDIEKAIEDITDALDKQHPDWQIKEIDKLTKNKGEAN